MIRTLGGVMIPQLSAPTGSGPHTSRSGARTFAEKVQHIARRLFFSARNLTSSDKQFLGDLARAERRYEMKALQRLIGIAERSDRPEDREALAELIRAECLRSTPAVRDVGVAFDLETRAQGEADVAQRAFERRRTRATKEAAIEKLTTHLYGLRASLDAVEATPTD
jgi:hypothetical protein